MEKSDLACEFENATSYLAIHVPKPSVIILTLRGHVKKSPDNITYAEALGAAVGAGGEVSVFFDLLEMTGYDSQLRVALTEALKQRADKCREIVVRAESRLVRMGVSVARLALPNLESVDNDVYDQRVAAALSR